MKVKLFDESDESDLENELMKFISEKKPDIIDIKYSVACSVSAEEQIYCFSAMVLYR